MARTASSVLSDAYDSGNQGVRVTNQNRSEPIIIGNFNKIINSTTLAANVAKDATTVTLTDGTGVVVGTYLIIFSTTTNRVYIGTVTDIASAPTYTLDTPLDSAFVAGDFADVTTDQLNIDGSSATSTYGLRGASVSPAQITIDVSRIIFECLTTDPVTLAKFGDLTALTKGIVVRQNNGMTYNIINAKTNGDLARYMYDFTPYLATNPAQGQNGFVARLTFSGDEKVGSCVRLMPGEDLQILIQDNLTTLLSFKVTAEGYINTLLSD